MAVDKKSVLLYCDLIHTVEKLDDKSAGELFKHYLRYINDLEPTTENVLVDVVFESIKQNLKRDLKKWDSIKEKRSLAGKRSAELRQQNSTKVTSVESVEQASTNPTVTVTVNGTVTDKVIKKNIEERKTEFKNSLTPFLTTYSKDLLNNFFQYWTEHGEKDKKMKFEKQKSFGISQRLTTWKANEKKFGAKKETLTGAAAFKNQFK